MTTALPPGRIAIAVSLDVNFLAPADGDVLVTRAEALQVGSTLSVASVDVATARNGEESRCALCVVTLRAVAMPPSAEER